MDSIKHGVFIYFRLVSAKLPEQNENNVDASDFVVKECGNNWYESRKEATIIF